MAGAFTPGEVKVRPGTYFNIQKVGENSLASSINGVTAVLFKADWGPLNELVEINAGEDYTSTFGTALTTDAIAEAISGGAKTVMCCRIGSEGTVGSISIKSSSAQEALTIKTKYVGNKQFTLTIREKLADSTKKECIIYTGTSEFEKVEFTKDDDEVSALAAAFSNSRNFTVQKLASGKLVEISQQAFTAGTNPTATTESYSRGLEVLETATWNTICVDTELTEVQVLVSAYLDRIFEMGQFAMAVIAEKSSVTLENRMKNAAAFNSEKIVYVVNPAVKTGVKTLDGYQTAARVAGMISACPSNQSLTHTVVSSVTELVEKLTPTQITKAETKGCLVLSTNPNKQIWIDSAINTLVTLASQQDDGWKKIRRTKTRYELLSRANIQAESLVGKVDNDTNGRATIVSQIHEIGSQMVAEGKLVSCEVTESTAHTSTGDSCWFDIDAIDKDSAEHIYLTYKFRFNTEE